jgi:DNA recombination protein RmuC
VLGEVKTAFTKFGDTLDVVRDRLEKAVNTVDDARKKSKTLQGKLRAVEEVPGMSGEKFLEDESAPELE